MFDAIKRKYICDAEIGSPKKGWKGCRKVATFKCAAHYHGELHWCAGHAYKAEKPLSEIISN